MGGGGVKHGTRDPNWDRFNRTLGYDVHYLQYTNQQGGQVGANQNDEEKTRFRNLGYDLQFSNKRRARRVRQKVTTSVRNGGTSLIVSNNPHSDFYSVYNRINTDVLQYNVAGREVVKGVEKPYLQRVLRGRGRVSMRVSVCL